jgi:hypothetical protein
LSVGTSTQSDIAKANVERVKAFLEMMARLHASAPGAIAALPVPASGKIDGQRTYFRHVKGHRSASLKSRANRRKAQR